LSVNISRPANDFVIIRRFRQDTSSSRNDKSERMLAEYPVAYRIGENLEIIQREGVTNEAH
jgi:hypothetical protein